MPGRGGMGRGPAIILILLPVPQGSLWSGETEALLGRRKCWAGQPWASLPLSWCHPWGFSPGAGPPLPKPSGDWFINYGVFMETSSRGRSCRIPGGGFEGQSHLLPLPHPIPRCSQSSAGSTQRCWGPSLRGIHPPLSPAGPPLPGGISSSCHRSRSMPLIAVSYLGVNGDVLSASTATEAARRDVLELSWERDTGRHLGLAAGRKSRAGNGVSTFPLGISKIPALTRLQQGGMEESLPSRAGSTSRPCRSAPRDVSGEGKGGLIPHPAGGAQGVSPQGGGDTRAGTEGTQV